MGILSGLFDIVGSIFGFDSAEDERRQREEQARAEQNVVANQRAYNLDVEAATTYAGGLTGSGTQAEVAHRQGVVSARNRVEISRIEMESDIAHDKNQSGLFSGILQGIGEMFLPSPVDDIFKPFFGESSKPAPIELHTIGHKPPIPERRPEYHKPPIPQRRPTTSAPVQQPPSHGGYLSGVENYLSSGYDKMITGIMDVIHPLKN